MRIKLTQPRRHYKRPAYKCPVCRGKGMIPGGFYDGARKCRACGGTGIIWGKQNS